MVKLTIEEVTEKFRERQYRLLSKEYLGVSQKLEYECSIHVGKTNTIRYSDFRRGSGCRYCGTEKRDAARRTPFSEVRKTFEGKGYRLLSNEYKNSHSPLPYLCKKHPSKSTLISYSSIKAGKGCTYCAGLGKPDIIDIWEEFDLRGYELITKDYKNDSSHLEYRCEKHPNIISKVSYGNFKRLGHGCTHCSGNFRYDLDMARKVFREVGYELMEKEYINNTTPMRYKCPNHPKEEMYITLKAIRIGIGCSLCSIESRSGANHPSYNPEITEEERIYKRRYPEYVKWREAVFKRDSYSCCMCGDNTGGNLVAHHKDGYGWNKQRRTEEDNGVTLCEICHLEFHKEYGFGGNTEAQYDEWVTQKGAEIIWSEY